MINATRQTYFAPYDDCETALLTQVGAAKTQVLVADYSYNLENLTQALISLHKAGVVVSMVLDSSQSKGKTEVPEIAQLKAAGIPLAIGTSSEHKIMHNKFAIIDGVVVCSGSYNFTGTANHEDNFMDVEHSIERATAFTDVWQKMLEFIKTSEPTGIFNQ